MACPVFLKALYVERLIYQLTGTWGLGAQQVVIHDAWFLGSALSLFYLSCFKNPAYLAVFFRVLSLLLIVFYVVDLLVILNFNTRLVLDDVVKYSSYAPQYIQQSINLKAVLSIILFCGLVGSFAIFMFLKYQVTTLKGHLTALLSIFCLWITSYLYSEESDKYVHSWIYTNFIAHNINISAEAKPYSKQFIDKLNPETPISCVESLPKKMNVIILMVESLSAYQSNFFSRINSWTPNIDRIASENTAFTNFFANGFTTEDGEISLLTGRLPIYPPSNYSETGGTSFNGFYNVSDALPKIYNEKGYVTEFLTTSDLAFSNTGVWAKSIGFQRVTGHESAYFDSWRRSIFNAAPDEALFKLALERIDEYDNESYFLFLKTVSTHHPFVHPETKIKSEAEVFRYTDRQIGLFYDNLHKTGFFNNGVLIIVGDHHSMVPLLKQEIEKFGALRAAARVPLIISTGKRKAVVEDKPFQQIDVFNGLKNQLSKLQCVSPWVGDAIGHIPPMYIGYRRGDKRNIISVFLKEKDFSVILNGDDTYIDSNHFLTPKNKLHILNKINFERTKLVGREYGRIET